MSAYYTCNLCEGQFDLDKLLVEWTLVMDASERMWPDKHRMMSGRSHPAKSLLATAEHICDQCARQVHALIVASTKEALKRFGNKLTKE